MIEEVERKLISLEIERMLKVDQYLTAIGASGVQPMQRASKKRFLKYLKSPKVIREPDNLNISTDGLIEATWCKNGVVCVVLFNVNQPLRYHWSNKPRHVFTNLSCVM